MAEKNQDLLKGKKNKGSSTAPANQPNEAPESHGKKETQVQDPASGNSDKSRKVPATVRNIHQTLESPETTDIRLFMNILRMAEEHPAGVVLTLLRCAPTCDRAATVMWSIIGSSGSTLEKVLPILLSVMEDWPLHSMFTSDGDNTSVFALAATLVLWVIIQVPKSHEAVKVYAPHLVMDLLVLIFNSTVDVTEEVDTFWKQCQEEHQLHINPSSFAVRTLKSLFYRLRCDNLVMEMERKRGWDTLLCADTQHYAVGLLAREMRRHVVPLSARIACHLLGLLSAEGYRWDLPLLAFLVEVLECVDLSECSDIVLEMISRYLQGECRERRRLALRGLVVLVKDPSMARRIGILSQRLVDVLGDEDEEVIRMSLTVFLNVLRYKCIMISSTTAPKLAEALLLLFEHDNSHVRLLSIQLFQKMMDFVVNEGKKPLKRIVSQSLLPLYLHCCDENLRVAEASQETLYCAAWFLKNRRLKQAAKKDKLYKFGKCLLTEDRSLAADYLRQALPYLESPQESLREAAVRFIGMAGRYLRGQPAELHVLGQALQAMSKDESPSSTSLEIQAIFGQRSAELRSSAGFKEPLSQEKCQELVKRSPPFCVTDSDVDAESNETCGKLP